MSKYDRAVTVFSPDGHLMQVQYAQEAVRKGSPVIGIRGTDVIVLATEKRAVEKLQDDRTEKKIVPLDEHVVLAFAGLRADARVLISRAQIECQSHRLIVEDAVKLEYITRFIAEQKQKYTQSNGRRPYGISCLIAGFDYDGDGHLFQTEPSGTFYEWKACSIGRGEKTAREFLEKHYNDTATSTEKGTIKLAIMCLLEIVHYGQKNLDVMVLKKGDPVKFLNQDEINAVISEIEVEKEKERETKS
ncbi:Proteasome subunit alpha type-7-like [Papilio xuthus]|uniref:Proteasome subunit alpha type-7-like n=1 Tax=Papilio xuthus TaxID=66420 RepID=A0A194Q593_PAPXU|nr:Proteasome subunit alpha type-7-like [Papilio xuthus]